MTRGKRQKLRLPPQHFSKGQTMPFIHISSLQDDYFITWLVFQNISESEYFQFRGVSSPSAAAKRQRERLTPLFFVVFAEIKKTNTRLKAQQLVLSDIV